MMTITIYSVVFNHDYRRCELLCSNEYQHGCLPSIKQSQKGKHVHFCYCCWLPWRVKNLTPAGQIYWFIKIIVVTFCRVQHLRAYAHPLNGCTEKSLLEEGKQ